MQLSGRSRQQAFTLVELAVVMVLIGLLLGSLMYTLSAQVDQRAREQTQRTLDQAREALLGYAIANGRLPCPASAASNGIEAPAVVGGADCSNYNDGFLPAVTLGFQPTDSSGYALDAWNNRIRYAVSRSIASCAGTSTVPHFTHKANLKANGMSCQPGSSELLVCKSTASAPAPAAGNCGGAGDNAVTNTGTVVAVIFSTGKNYANAQTAAAAAAAGRNDEAANLDGNTVYISHVVAPSSAAGGEYDDMMVWIPVGLLYSRLASAGVLP